MQSFHATAQPALRFGRMLEPGKTLQKNPLPDAMVRNTMHVLARDWGIPQLLLPEIKWSETMVGRGGSAIEENRISLNSGMKPEQALTTLQHELHHHFHEVYLSTIPMPQLFQDFNTAFTESFRDGLITQIPVLDNSGVCHSLFPVPAMSNQQQQQFAGALGLILGTMEQQGTEYSFSVPDAAQTALNAMLAPSSNTASSSLDSDSLGTLLNTALTRYIDCRNGLAHSAKLQGFRQHPDFSQIHPRKAYNAADLVKTYFLRNEANLVMLQQYNPETLQGEPRSMLTYYFTRGEAQARIHEEALFTKLADTVNACEGSGKLPGNPHILDLWKQQVARTTRRIQTLEAGEKAILENRLSEEMETLQEARIFSEDESLNKPRQELNLYQAADKAQRREILKEKREWRDYTRDFLKTLTHKLPTLEDASLRQTVVEALANYTQELRQTEAFLKLCGLLHRVSSKMPQKGPTNVKTGDGGQ